MESKEMMKKICELLDEKKGQDIVAVDVTEMTTLADYFVICSAKSTTAVRALFDNLDEGMSKLGFEPKHKEGVAEGRWVCADYGDVIVHIFHDETRLFYHLERLWDTGNNALKFPF